MNDSRARLTLGGLSTDSAGHPRLTWMQQASHNCERLDPALLPKRLWGLPPKDD
jgi:hypothetical protein